MGATSRYREWNGVPSASGFACDYVRGGWRVECIDKESYRWRVHLPGGSLTTISFDSARGAIDYANVLIAQDEKAE